MINNLRAIGLALVGIGFVLFYFSNQYWIRISGWGLSIVGVILHLYGVIKAMKDCTAPVKFGQVVSRF